MIAKGGAVNADADADVDMDMDMEVNQTRIGDSSASVSFRIGSDTPRVRLRAPKLAVRAPAPGLTGEQHTTSRDGD